MTLRHTTALAVYVVCFTPSAALGAEPVTAAGSAPCAPSAEPGEKTHDGFFLRSAPGLAFFWAKVDGSTAPARRTGIRGIGQSSALELGGTPARGLVLGGTIWTGILDPVFIEGGRRVSSDDDSVKLTQLRLGPFVDWYPEPSSGFHANAAIGLVVELESDVKGDAIEPLGYGASLATGAGYEWFVSSSLSIGFLARFAFGAVTRETRGVAENTLFVLPDLALTATYH